MQDPGRGARTQTRCGRRLDGGTGHESRASGPRAGVGMRNGARGDVEMRAGEKLTRTRRSFLRACARAGRKEIGGDVRTCKRGGVRVHTCLSTPIAQY